MLALLLAGPGCLPVDVVEEDTVDTVFRNDDDRRAWITRLDTCSFDDAHAVPIGPNETRRVRAAIGETLRVYSDEGWLLDLVPIGARHVVPSEGCTVQLRPCTLPPFVASDRWTPADFEVFQNDAPFAVTLYYVNRDLECEERVVDAPLASGERRHLHTTHGHTFRARRDADAACVWEWAARPIIVRGDDEF